MGLEEDIPKIIEENRLAREKETADLNRFEDGWESARDTIIKPRLKIAADLLRSHLDVVSDVQRDNGGIVLHVNERRSEKKRRLWFNKDKQARKVVCDSSLKDLQESFDLENVTPDEVDRKIREFVKAIA